MMTRRTAQFFEHGRPVLVRAPKIKPTKPSFPRGYILIFLMIAIFVLGLSLLVAVPALETQLRREKEEELIFRGRQYIEAIRLYQQKKPGAYPSSLDELVEEKCLRKVFPDPMSATGKWNLLLIPPLTPTSRTLSGASQPQVSDKFLVVPEQSLRRIRNPQIAGVVSSSNQKAIKIYSQEEYYNQWLFYYGQKAGKKPELIYQTDD